MVLISGFFFLGKQQKVEGNRDHSFKLCGGFWFWSSQKHHI